ncbi:hypothetical protein JXB28_05845 [Candidatus Woesearchaeota archaeon]|nr:hypothetical protein [Candidatus Woesearchaeota archaeon]
MDFEKFIDIDIIEFLDEQALAQAEKSAEVREEEFDLYEITQDYTLNITKALKEGNLKKAQEIFEDVKSKYNKAPADSLNKKRLYIIMEEIFEKIKDYESQEEGKKNLFETIREYEETGLFATPGQAEKKAPETIGLLLSTIHIKEKELEKITTKQTLNHYDFARAIQRYRQLKELIKRIPAEHEQEKAKSYESALTWYYTIKKLKERLDKEEESKIKEEAAKEQQDERPIEEKLAEVRRIKEEIIQSHMRIVELVRKKELQASIEEYRKLKALCEEFPYEMEAEKTALLADALSMYESIKRLKQELAKEGKEKKEAHEQEQAQEEKEQAAKQQIISKISKVRECLSKQDSEGAAREYNEIREMFRGYREGSLEEKKELFDQIMKAHQDIRKLHEEAKKKSSPGNEKKTEGIQEKLNHVQELIDSEQVDEATQLLLEAKHQIEMLPHDAFDDKYSFTKQAEAAEHKLLFLKNMHRIAAPIGAR